MINITAKMSVVMGGIFAAVCLSVAITGFVSSGDWTLPGVIGAVGAWIARTQKDESQA